MKRSIIKQFVLALCLLCTLTASAFDFEVDGICYNFNEDLNTVRVTYRYQESNGLDYTGDVVIPKNVTYNGKSYLVTRIGKSAFYGCTNLTSVNIPNSVFSIDAKAFFACNGLTRITIPNSVTSIEEWAFYNCSKLTRIAIPRSVTFIAATDNKHAFEGCNGVNTIIVESGNPVYDSRNNCNAIIETSSNKLIYGCVNTIIPNSVTAIGKYAFAYCNRISHIEIPGSVTSIGDNAFFGCNELEDISIPNSVYYIGTYAFGLCNNLKSASIGNSVSTIDVGAFWCCNNLTSVNIPNSVTSINESAFYGTSIKEIFIPKSVTFIGNAIFEFCDSLSVITVDKLNDKFDSRNNCNAIIETESNTLIAGCKTTVIPSTISAIGDYAFKSCRLLTNISIPNSITSIGIAAFNNCKNLSEISIPNSVTLINETAFYYCTSLKNITIPNSVISIGRSAFDYSGLKTITIGKSVSFIGRYAFSVCDSLELVTCLAMIPPQLENLYAFPYSKSPTLRVPKDALTSYKNTEGWNFFPIIEGFTDRFEVDGIYYQWTGDNTVSVTYKDENYNSYSGNIVIPSSVTFEGETYQVTEIGEYAFSFSENLTSVSIPNSVTRIGDCAFQECSKLNNIVIPNSVEEIGNHAFDYSGLTNVNLGNSIKRIGANAFTGCQFTSLTLPDGLLSIGENAFSECSLMKSINLPGSLVSIGELAFDMCSSLSAITIPNSVSYIGLEAFEECHALISMKVEYGNEFYDSRNNCNAIIETATNTLIAGCKTSVIPNSVLAIGDYAFALCSGLKTITIPTYVKTIGHAAFMGCYDLNTIIIGANVISLGEYAFFDCDNVTSVTCFAALPPSLYSIECFSSCAYDNAVLRVPATSFENYIFSEYWSEFLNIETLVNGDVDGDGKVNISDVTTLIDMLLRGTTANANADIDGDGNVNISDVTTLIDILLRQ